MKKKPAKKTTKAKTPKKIQKCTICRKRGHNARTHNKHR